MFTTNTTTVGLTHLYKTPCNDESNNNHNSGSDTSMNEWRRSLSLDEEEEQRIERGQLVHILQQQQQLLSSGWARARARPWSTWFT